MHIDELRRFNEEELNDLVNAMSPDQQEDFNDGLLFTIGEYKEREDRRYFDDIDEYMDHLVKNTRIVDSPEVIRSHELAHAKCMKLLGAISVKFYTRITKFRESTIEYGAFTQWFSPIDLPNIAFAAVAAAPKKPSPVDMKEIRIQSGYHDLGYLKERIEKWNEEDHGLKIPLPGELEE